MENLIPQRRIVSWLTYPAHVFVAVLRASNYTFAEATLDQTLGNWIGSHTRAFTYFGGVSSLIVPDNLKSGVTKAHVYDPDINPTYHEMVAYYDTAVMPARSYKPRGLNSGLDF